jgi:hypothetical protein
MSVEKLASAFAFVQKVLGTRFEISFSEGVEEASAIIEVDRTARGIGDRGAFLVGYDPAELATRSEDDFLSDALHEWLHMIQFDAFEAGQEGRRAKATQAYRDAHESGIHALERSLLPLLRARKRRIRCRKPTPAGPRSSPPPQSAPSPAG